MIGGSFYVIELYIIFFVLSKLYGEKMKFSLNMILFLFLDILIIKTINMTILPEQISLLIYPEIILYEKIQYKSTILEAIKNLIIAALGICILQFFVSGVVFGFFENTLSESRMASIVNICVLLIIIFTCHFVKVDEVVDLLTDKLNQIKLIACQIIIILVIGVLLFKYLGKMTVFQMISISALSSSAGISIILWNKQQKEMELKIEDIKKEENYKDAFKDMIMKIRRKQHDYDNKLNAIYAMAMTTGSYEELIEKQREYEKNDLDDKYSKMLNQNSSSVLIGFLYIKFNNALKFGIVINPHIVIDKAECKISEREIIEIIGIIFDNAVEAVKDKEDTYKKIKVTILEYKDCIKISIMNRSDYISQNEIEKFFKDGYSTKGNERGLGLGNVKRIVNPDKGSIMAENVVEEEQIWFLIQVLVNK